MIYGKIKSAVGLLLLCTGSLAAQGPVGVEWQDSTQLRLSFALTGGHGLRSDYSEWAVPVLGNARGDTLRLGPSVFRGRRNRRYVERGRLYGTSAPVVGREAGVGDTLAYDVVLRRADVPWLWDGAVTLTAQREREGCCNVEPMPAMPLARFAYVPPFVPALALVADNTGKAGELQRENPVLQHISQYRPYDTTRVLRKEHGALYVHFPLDRAELRHDFRDNAATLDRIVDITRSIMADSTSEVKVIQVVGLASVDGPQRHNQGLAGRRAEALKRYVQDRVAVPDTLFECANGGEGWVELRDQIADSRFPGRDELLRIIDTEPEPDRREVLIRRLRGGKAYAYLRDNVLGDQRNSGYLHIYYDYVPDTVAAVINRATELLWQERPGEALQLLLTVRHDERAQNALGVACYLTGDRSTAFGCFRRAAERGNAQARENLRQCEAIGRAEKAMEGTEE